jgi:hypothetical protein
MKYDVNDLIRQYEGECDFAESNHCASIEVFPDEMRFLIGVVKHSISKKPPRLVVSSGQIDEEALLNEGRIIVHGETIHEAQITPIPKKEEKEC